MVMVITFPFCPPGSQEDQSVIYEIPKGNSQIAETWQTHLFAPNDTFFSEQKPLWLCLRNDSAKSLVMY